MPLYLSRFSYTPETWARLIGNPEDRRDAAKAYIESVGGKLHGFWYAFGAHDGYNLWEAPDDVSMAAVALAISGGGALSSFETTVLLSVDETMEGRSDSVPGPRQLTTTEAPAEAEAFRPSPISYACPVSRRPGSCP
ncbi:MAG TPA: GYD domain-containing protein [Thermoleophilaceae bacterium]|nr:GYD domain-containing protein [Thermoleophilaceae bacterium]